MNESLITKEDLLNELNDERFVLLIPVVVYLAILGIFGLVGNVFVFAFYGCKSEKSAANVFILDLCVSDLAVCCICVPIEIVDVRLFYIFNNAAACKILRYINHVATFNSCFILCAIAGHRYRKICHPLGNQLTTRSGIIICLIGVFCSVLVSIPAAVVYSNMPVNVTNEYYPDLTGMDCTTERSGDADMVLIVFTIFQLITGSLIFIALAVLYSIIGRTMYRHQKRTDERRNTWNATAFKTVCHETEFSSTQESQETNESADQRSDQEEEKHKLPTNSTEIKLEYKDCQVDEELKSPSDTPENKSSTSMGPQTQRNIRVKEETRNQLDTSTKNHSSEKHETRERHVQHIDDHTRKFTILMLTISGVFFLSFVPYVIVVAWRYFEEPFQGTNAGVLWGNLMLRSYFLNSTLNPFIYGLFNSNFRTLVYRALFPCIRK